MAAQTNGRLKKPKSAGLNGHLNGNANGHLNGHLNGNADVTKSTGPVVRSRSTQNPKKTIMGSLLSLVTRLLSWYIIATVCFRCPSSISKLDDTSPRICKPYLHARSYAAPYIDPYYQAYVAPQVEKVQPYVDMVNKRVYTPVSTFTKAQYTAYGAPQVDKVQKYIEAEWNRSIRPRIQEQYQRHLGPHVEKVVGLTEPHYKELKTSLHEIYDITLLPAYKAVLPYSRTAYTHGHHLVAHVIFPSVRSAKDATLIFVSRTVWPYVRILYADNVEPQLVRIRERLGRYRDGKRLEAAVSAAESSAISSMTTDSSVPTAPSIPSIVDPSSALDMLSEIWEDEPKTTQSESETSTVSQPTKSPQPSLSKAELKEKLNNDLRQWQTKFAVAADKGSEDLEERVAEITKRQVENGVHGHGAALLVQLEETSKSTIEKFKAFVKQTAESLPEDAPEKDLESAYEKCIGQSRALGLTVKEKAQAIRAWKSAYDQETDYLVKSAVESTLDVLRRIHDLGLQEVGLRWAWTDGVTYKDWQNYHKLRDMFTEWEGEVEAVGSAHDGLRVAHEESKKLEDKAMAVASELVREMLRLKEASRYKIWMRDASDDFSDRKVPVRPLKAAQDAVKNVGDKVSKVSESISESIVGAASSMTESTETKSEVDETPEPSVESSTSESATEQSSATYNSNIATADEEQPSVVEVESVQQVKVASDVPKKVFGGAMAQVLAEAREIILDDEIDDSDDTYSEKMQSMVSEVGDRAADLSRAVSAALLGSTTRQGTVESVTSIASEQYEKALSAASSVLYGTPQGRVESATSVASDKFAQAVTAASYAVYGTPTPTAVIKSIQVQASSQYDNAIIQAKAQYSKALAEISAKISGTPAPAHEQLKASVEKVYSDSLAAASAKLQAALQYTDSAKSYAYGPTQGVLESASSIAASKLSEGLSLASAQFQSQPTPVLGDARRRYYEAIGLAHARYAEFLDTASSAVYGPQQGTFESIASVVSETAQSLASEASSTVIGTKQGTVESIASVASASAESLASEASSAIIGSETLWTESIASQASQNWEALISKASSQVYGTPTPFVDSVYSSAASYGAQATAQAAAQYAAVQALISELVVGKEPDFTESVMNRLSSAYYTAYPAAMSSASSYASENYESASSYAADAYQSASSVVSSLFTPPPVIETILGDASDQINSAVDRVSIQLYGTPKGTVEQATESVASAYSSIQSKASEAIYGTAEAQSYFADVAANAQKAISNALFTSTPTASGYVASITSGAADAYSSAASVAADAAAAASSAIYGPEQGAMESATSRLSAAIESANSRMAELLANAGSSAADAASTVSSVASAATQSIKDEL